MWGLQHVKTHMYMCAWDMFMHMCTCIWTHTALDTYIRAYECTYLHIHIHLCLGAFVDIITTDVSICIHMNFHVFAHMYVNMHTHVHMYIFVHMYDLKWSKQSIDLFSNNHFDYLCNFHFDYLGTRTLVYHHTHFNFLFYFSKTIKGYFSKNHFFLIPFCLDE